MEDYSNTEFWTEARMLRQRECFLNIIKHPEQFPRANMDGVWVSIEDIETALMRYHPTVAVLTALTTV